MAIPILKTWKNYFADPHEGLGSSYERIILNDLLLHIQRTYSIETVLETPIFGFTGLTGLNSIALAQKGCKVTLTETDAERTKLVSDLLMTLKLPVSITQIEKYISLPFEKGAFDMSWNFSAMWFVEDMTTFLSELARVTSKVILICVPNQCGLGYKWQKAHAEIPQGVIFNEAYINLEKIKSTMHTLKWQFQKEAFIDCPLWPDIGMNKESFFGKYLVQAGLQKQAAKPRQTISILDYYKSKDPGFPDRMRHYAFFEKWAPVFFKRIWSHHHWMLFTSPKSV